MNGVLHLITQERKSLENRLGAVRAAEVQIRQLVGNGNAVKRSTTRPAMSASARARIAAAQRARWAKWKRLQGR